VPKVTPEQLRERVAMGIRETAKRKGITLAALADRAGVSEGGLHLALSGNFFAKLAAALDVDPDELVKLPQASLTIDVRRRFCGQRRDFLGNAGLLGKAGPRPAWLDAACRMEVTGLTAGSAVIAIEAPTLEEAIPERFASGGSESMFFYGSAHAIAKRTSIDVFAGVLSAAIEGRADQVLADRPLLDTCIRFVRASGSAFDGIQLGGLGPSLA